MPAPVEVRPFQDVAGGLACPTRQASQRRDEHRGHFRREYGRCVATLVRFFGDIDLAEEAVQEAFTVAVDRWPRPGLPPNPGAWITTTAQEPRDRPVAPGGLAPGQARPGCPALRPGHEPDAEQVGPVKDDRLRLIFTCCHPALATSAQVALTLRLLGGLQTPEIARAFLVPEADDGPADRPGQEEDQGGRDPVPGARRRGTARPAARRARGRST